MNSKLQVFVLDDEGDVKRKKQEAEKRLSRIFRRSVAGEMEGIGEVN